MKQAALYRAHGLLSESRQKYEEILSFLESNHQFQNAEKLANEVQNFLEDVEYDILFRDLRERFFDLSERAFLEYSDSLGCTGNKGYSWMRRGVSLIRAWITDLRLKCGLLGKKRIWF
jgi:hypothetical protein